MYEKISTSTLYFISFYCSITEWLLLIKSSLEISVNNAISLFES